MTGSMPRKYHKCIQISACLTPQHRWENNTNMDLKGNTM